MSSNVFRRMCLFRSLRLYNSLYSNNKLDLFINKRLIFGINKPPSNEKHSQSEQQQEVENTSEVKREVDDRPQDTTAILLAEKIKENEKLIELTKEIADKYKRSLADGENTRIRAKKQIEDAKLYGIQNFCKDLLDIADVLHTAINSVPKDATTDATQVWKNFFSGVQMTEQQLQTVLRRHGVTQINPIGQKFNPNEHHALFEAIDNSKEPGSVSIVTKIGYKLHDRTIRPAMVGVVKCPSTSQTPPS